MSACVKLEEVRDGQVINRYALNGQQRNVFKIGRNQKADVQVRDSHASRLHATLDLSSRRPILRDMGSAVGTLVNGKLIERAPLKSDDEIRIGDTVLRVKVAPRGDRERPPTLPAKGELQKEVLVDKMATLTPHRMEQLSAYADYLRELRAKGRGIGLAPVPLRKKAAAVTTGQETKVQPANREKRKDATKAPAIGAVVYSALPTNPPTVRTSIWAAGLLALLVGVGSLASAGSWFPALTESQAVTAPPPAPPVVAPAPTTRTYTIQTGDSLSVVARDQLGDVSRWEEIFALNRSALSSPTAVEVGQVIQLPAK